MATNNSQKLNKLNWLLVIAILLLIITLGFYFFNFKNGLGADSSNWGTFGDFMGGTLNPIFALFSLFAIIYTIKIQTQELEFSREELKATKEELEKQSESFEIQNYSIKLQTFENTFFKLLEQHNDILDEISSKNLLTYETASGQNEFSEEEYTYCNKNELIEYFKLTNQKTIIKNYFMLLYQLFKFIYKESIKNKFDGKLYTNMIRSVVHDEILKSLAVNIIGYEFNEYKKYIEKYSFFEHLYINGEDEKYLSLLFILKEFNKSQDNNAFGSNEGLIRLLKEKTAKE